MYLYNVIIQLYKMLLMVTYPRTLVLGMCICVKPVASMLFNFV